MFVSTRPVPGAPAAGVSGAPRDGWAGVLDQMTPTYPADAIRRLCLIAAGSMKARSCRVGSLPTRDDHPDR